jgi:hypothetical protein
MNTPQKNKLSGLLDKLKNFVANPVVNGVSSLFGFVGLILGNNNSWIQFIAVIVALVCGSYFLYSIRDSILSSIRWLTWKFVMGLSLGVIISAIATPLVFQPVLLKLLMTAAPKIEFLESMPKDGKELSSISDRIRIIFAKPVPWPYFVFAKVEIDPPFPIEHYWVGDTRVLFIEPRKYFAGTISQRFEYNAKYRVMIWLPTLRESVQVRFCTPDENVPFKFLEEPRSCNPKK